MPLESDIRESPLNRISTQNGIPFRGINIHIYLRSPQPANLYNPGHLQPTGLLQQGIAELDLPANAYNGSAVLRNPQHTLALSYSILSASYGGGFSDDIRDVKSMSRLGTGVTFDQEQVRSY